MFAQRVRSSRGFLTTTALVAVFAVTFVSPTFAASPTGGELQTLWQENRLAQKLVDLNLTPEQVEAFKVAVQDLQAMREEVHTQIATLLAERRDALLEGAEETLSELDEELRATIQEAMTVGTSALKDFMEGLTERQEQIVHQLVGHVGAVVLHRSEGHASPMMLHRREGAPQDRSRDARLERRQHMPDRWEPREAPRVEREQGPRGLVMRRHASGAFLHPANSLDLEVLLSLLDKMSE